MSEGKMIYHLKVRAAWKKKRGNGYMNMYRGTKDDALEIVTIGRTTEELNTNPVLVSQVMKAMGLTGKAIYDFHFIEVFDAQELSRSFYHKEDE